MAWIFFKQEHHDLNEFRSRWQCAHGRCGWWVIVFATSISMMDFKGFIGDYQWNQRVNFIIFFQFRILFLGETNFLSALWFIKCHRQFTYIKHKSCHCDTCGNVLLKKNSQIAFPKHLMILSRNTVVPLIRKIVCLVISLKLQTENCVSLLLIATLIRIRIRLLVTSCLSTGGKHQISVSLKYVCTY